MKYLKKFFESVEKHITVEEFNQIKSYLNDVFLELKDDDYIVSIWPIISDSSEEIMKRIFRQRAAFDYSTILRSYKGIYLNIKTSNKEAFISSDILDPLKHAVSYLSDIGFNGNIKISEKGVKIRPHGNYYTNLGPWRSVNLEDLEEDYICKEVNIDFKL